MLKNTIEELVELNNVSLSRIAVDPTIVLFYLVSLFFGGPILTFYAIVISDGHLLEHPGKVGLVYGYIIYMITFIWIFPAMMLHLIDKIETKTNRIGLMLRAIIFTLFFSIIHFTTLPLLAIITIGSIFWFIKWSIIESISAIIYLYTNRKKIIIDLISAIKSSGNFLKDFALGYATSKEDFFIK